MKLCLQWSNELFKVLESDGSCLEFQAIVRKPLAHFPNEIYTVLESQRSCCDAMSDGLESAGGCCGAICIRFLLSIKVFLESAGSCLESPDDCCDTISAFSQ